jgi:hypothetical protein
MTPVRRVVQPAKPAVEEGRRRWLLLVHQLPTKPSNLRVRTWRRLQQLGAVSLKQAVYVLPDSPSAREDFEWLKTEIQSAGGDATVFAADSVDAWSDDALVEEFRRSRQEAYASLSRDVEQALQRLGATRQRRGRRAPAAGRLLEAFRQRFTAIERLDFFGSAGRDRVVTLLKEFETRASTRTRGRPVFRESGQAGREAYRRRLWVTRPRPGVDRMASAWLIRRFIDPRARFGFVVDRGVAPRGAIPFDMFGVEFSHKADHCTFETLCSVFDIDDAGVRRLAAIVHDLDMKDGRFGTPEAASIGMVIEGLQLAYGDDDALLEQGRVLFESLYRSAEQSARLLGPRAVAAAEARRKKRRGGTEARRS